MRQPISTKIHIHPQLPVSFLRCRLLLLFSTLGFLLSLQRKQPFSTTLPFSESTSLLSLLLFASASSSSLKISSAPGQPSHLPHVAASRPVAVIPTAAAPAAAAPAAAAALAAAVAAAGLRVSSGCGEGFFGEARGAVAVAAPSAAQGHWLFHREDIERFRSSRSFNGSRSSFNGGSSSCATTNHSSRSLHNIRRSTSTSSSNSTSSTSSPTGNSTSTSSRNSTGSSIWSWRGNSNNSCSRHCCSRSSFTLHSIERESSAKWSSQACLSSLRIPLTASVPAVPHHTQKTGRPSSLRAPAVAAVDTRAAAPAGAAGVGAEAEKKSESRYCLVKNFRAAAAVAALIDGSQLHDGAATGGSHLHQRQGPSQFARLKAPAPKAAAVTAATAAAKPLPTAARIYLAVPAAAGPIPVTMLLAEAAAAKVLSLSAAPPSAALLFRSEAAARTTASCLPPAVTSFSAAAAARPSAAAAAAIVLSTTTGKGLPQLPQKYLISAADLSSFIEAVVRGSSSSQKFLPLLLLQLPFRVVRVSLMLVPTAAGPAADDGAATGGKTAAAVVKSLLLPLLSRSLLLRVPLLLSAGALLLLLRIRAARRKKPCEGRSSSGSSNCSGASSARAAARAIAAFTLAEEVVSKLQLQIEQLKAEAFAFPALPGDLPSSSSNGTHSEQTNSSGECRGDSTSSRGGSGSSGREDSSSSWVDSSRPDYSCSGDPCRGRAEGFESGSRREYNAKEDCSNRSVSERQLPPAWEETQWKNEKRREHKNNGLLSSYSSAAAAYRDRLMELWHQAQHLLQDGLQQQQRQLLQQRRQQNLQGGAIEAEQQKGQGLQGGGRCPGQSTKRKEERQQHRVTQEDSGSWKLAGPSSRAADEMVPVGIDDARRCSRWFSPVEESSRVGKESLSCNCSLSSRNSSSSDSSSGDISSSIDGSSDKEHRRGSTATMSCPVAAVARQQLQNRFYSLAADAYRGLLVRLHEELLHQFRKEFACLVGGMPTFKREAERLRCTYTTLHGEACTAAALPFKHVIGKYLLQSCSRHAARTTSNIGDHCRWYSSSRWWRSSHGSWCSWGSISNSNNSSSICLECANEELSAALQRLIEERSREGVALKEVAAAIESLQAWKVVCYVAQLAAARLLPLLLQFVVKRLQQKITCCCSFSRKTQAESKDNSSAVAATSAATATPQQHEEESWSHDLHQVDQSQQQ